MRKYENWDTIFESGDYTLVTWLVINDDDENPYTSISAPKINRSLNGNALSIGNVNTATLEVSVLTDDSIPMGAKVEVRGKLKSSSMETPEASFGTFWVDKRSRGHGGLVNLTCYDAMMRANQLFNLTPQEIFTTTSMAKVVELVAERIGVQIDPRFTILDDPEGAEVPIYLMTPPTDMTMSEALGYIGQINGGNWIITEENKLRLVPLFYDEADTVVADAILGSYKKDATTSISKVVMVDSNNNEYSYGTSDGFVLTLKNPYANETFVSNLYDSLSGVTYYPYAITKSVVNPLFELGDTLQIVSTDTFNGQIMQVTMYLDLSFRVDIKAHETGKTQSEYPYESEYVRLLNAVQRTVDTTVATLNETVNGESENSVKTVLQNIQNTLDSLSLNYVSNQTLTSYIRFDEQGITLGASDSDIKLRITNDKMFFFHGQDNQASEENAIAYFSDGELKVNNVNTQQKTTIGNYYWQLETIDGSLSLIYQEPEQNT